MGRRMTRSHRSTGTFSIIFFTLSHVIPDGIYNIIVEGEILDRVVFLFFYTIFVSSHMYPENPEGTQVIVGSMNMGYISDTARNRMSQPVPSQAGADTTRPQ